MMPESTEPMSAVELPVTYVGHEIIGKLSTILDVESAEFLKLPGQETRS
ncbi:hypothetical protein ACVIU4_000936 [Bradyrhizobium barranii subsp. barranii]|nr:hypothetical protein [Bradyrhizobium japonicum]MCP1963834.1 hypothetical protein [Bradyrhizobium japonicum]